MRNHMLSLAVLGALFAAGPATGLRAADDGARDTSGAIINRTIGYAVTDKHWGVYVTKDKTECPEGFNDGPREQFKMLFPDNGKKWTVLETELAREGETWLPTTLKEPYPFHDAGGPIAYGLNLDGKVGPNDFTSPEGEKGIDNQLYRALGCIANYRGPDGFNYAFINKEMISVYYNRVLIELTNVDNLVNDDDVTVTTYRGRDGLMTDAAGAFMPGGTQRADYRWGKQFIQHFHGKIVNGVLTTDPADVYIPETDEHTNASALFIRGARFKLNITPDGAEGVLAGYADIDAFYYTLNETWSTHHQSYGQDSSPSLFRALHRLADGYPDPKTGANTAISSALQLKFVQAFVQHPPEEPAAKHVASAKAPAQDAGGR